MINYYVEIKILLKNILDTSRSLINSKIIISNLVMNSSEYLVGKNQM